MDTVNHYKSIARTIVEKIGTTGKSHLPTVKRQIIKDDVDGHYLIFNNGWINSGRRLYGCFLHIEVKPDAKVWLHHDGTDWEVGNMLVDAGIPKKQIVLSFHAPSRRADTEFAVA